MTALKALHWLTIAALASGACWFVVQLGLVRRSGTARCPQGLVAHGPRCCAAGQRLAEGRCRGIPRSCPQGMRVVHHPAPGCVAQTHRALLAGGNVRIGPSDWEAAGVVKPRTFSVEPFELDVTEVTIERWATCVTAGICAPRDLVEPGQPVTGMTPSEAERFCAFAGGRLPTGEQWLFAATGTEQRRFPWGPTGLVCRRAVYGLRRGPCSEDARSPEIVGARPQGATPEGVLDLAGNVAEWTREPDGTYIARGGHYRSRRASELKSWARETPRGASLHVGFRCAYSQPHSSRRARARAGSPE